MSVVEPAELAPGLWIWACRHPEWSPGEFGAEVVSFAARGTDDTLLLIDPLLPSGEGADTEVLELIDAEAGRAARVAIPITITYHVRSAQRLWERLGPGGAGHEVTICGHPAVAKRLGSSATAFEPIDPGVPLPGGAVGHSIGKRKRFETPLELPAHEAVVFGDSVVGVEGGLRVWSAKPIDEKVLAFYRESFNPTLEPIAEREPRRVLVTHGESILEGGAAALRRAIESPPWYHRG